MNNLKPNPFTLNALFCISVFHEIEIEELVLNAATGDLLCSFYIAQHLVHKRAAAATLLVNSHWPSRLAGIAKKAIFGKYCLFIAYLSADSCFTSLEIAEFNSHVCRDRF